MIIIYKIRNFLCKIPTLFLLLCTQVHAALPSIEKPQSGSDGSIFGDIKGYSQDGIVLGGLIAAAVAFLIVAAAALATFKEAQETNKWTKFGIVIVVGVILLVVIIWMVTKASGILN